MRRATLLVALACAVVLAACGEGIDVGFGDGADEAVTPLLKADGWRAGLDPAQSHFAVLEIAFDRETAERLWADNADDRLEAASGEPAEPGVYGSLDGVDFDRQVVAVWSSGESGTCPGWLADVRTADDGTVELVRDSTAGPGEPCTDDYRPYRLVVAIDRDRLPARDALPTETVGEVPDALVTTYPAG